MTASLSDRRADHGFTLVEILIAIVLVGISSAVVVVGVGSLTTKGASAACEASADAARAATAVRMVDEASTLTRIDQLTTSGAMSSPTGATVSADGLSLSTATWTLQLAPGVAPSFRCLPLLTPGLRQTSFGDTTLTTSVGTSTYAGAASVDFGGGGSVSIPTVAGSYSVEIEFVEIGGGANWSLGWVVPGTSSVVVVPAGAFSTASVPSVAITQSPTVSVLSSVSDALLLSVTSAQAPAAAATATCSAAGQPTRTGTGSPSPIGVGGLASGVPYSCTVAVGSSASSAPVVVTPGTGPGVAGLMQRTYSDTTLTSLALVSLNSTNARGTWGALGPTPSLIDNFSVRYTGAITLPSAGSYTFTSAADDVVRVWIDGNLVLPTAGSITFTATAGSHPIRIEYVEIGGGASWSLTWLVPGSGAAVSVPASAFTTL